jgi:hypothetical protein
MLCSSSSWKLSQFCVPTRQRTCRNSFHSGQSLFSITFFTPQHFGLQDKGWKLVMQSEIRCLQVADIISSSSMIEVDGFLETTMTALKIEMFFSCCHVSCRFFMDWAVLTLLPNVSLLISGRHWFLVDALVELPQ